MANGFYNGYLNGQLGSYTTFVDFDGDTMKLVATDHAGADGAPDLVNDDFYDDIDGSTVGSLSAALASKTIGGGPGAGVVDAADLAPAFTALSGASVESLTLLKDTGTPSTSALLAYWDTATGLPFTPSGGDVNVSFSASGIFKR